MEKLEQHGYEQEKFLRNLIFEHSAKTAVKIPSFIKT